MQQACNPVLFMNNAVRDIVFIYFYFGLISRLLTMYSIVCLIRRSLATGLVHLKYIPFQKYHKFILKILCWEFIETNSL